MWTAYCIIVMAIYWIFECVPLAVTSLIPVVILPLTGNILIYPMPIPVKHTGPTNHRAAHWANQSQWSTLAQQITGRHTGPTNHRAAHWANQSQWSTLGQPIIGRHTGPTNHRAVYWAKQSQWGTLGQPIIGRHTGPTNYSEADWANQSQRGMPCANQLLGSKPLYSKQPCTLFQIKSDWPLNQPVRQDKQISFMIQSITGKHPIGRKHPKSQTMTRKHGHTINTYINLLVNQKKNTPRSLQTC